MTTEQLVVGMRVMTPDGPGHVALIAQGYRTNFGRWHRHAYLVVELDDGQRKRFLRSEIQKEDDER